MFEVVGSPRKELRDLQLDDGFRSKAGMLHEHNMSFPTSCSTSFRDHPRKSISHSLSAVHILQPVSIILQLAGLN